LLKYSQNTTGVYFFLPHPVHRANNQEDSWSGLDTGWIIKMCRSENECDRRLYNGDAMVDWSLSLL